MHYFLLLFLLLLNISVFCQTKLDGTFKTSPRGTTFIFSQNGTFEYYSSDCLYSIEGKGKYSIRNNKLKLNFDFNRYQPIISSFIIENNNCDNPENNSPIFSIIDKETKNPLPTVDIYLMLKYSREIIAKPQTDSKGIATISRNILDKFQDSAVVAFSNYHLYEKRFFYFTLKPCQEIKIELVEVPHSHNQIIPNGTVWKYRIRKFSEEYSEGIILYEVAKSGHSKDNGTTLYKINQ